MRAGARTGGRLAAGALSLAIEASERWRISFWDGAILAAAREMGAKIVDSEDLGHDLLYGAVRVVNPFRGPD